MTLRTQKEEMEDLKTRSNKTSMRKAKADIQRFRNKFKNETDFINVSKESLLAFLNSNDNMYAVRVYFARNEKEENTLVFVGVDKNGENIILPPKKAAKKVDMLNQMPDSPAQRTQDDDGDKENDSFLNDFQTCPPPIPPDNNL